MGARLTGSQARLPLRSAFIISPSDPNKWAGTREGNTAATNSKDGLLNPRSMGECPRAHRPKAGSDEELGAMKSPPEERLHRSEQASSHAPSAPHMEW